MSSRNRVLLYLRSLIDRDLVVTTDSDTPIQLHHWNSRGYPVRELDMTDDSQLPEPVQLFLHLLIDGEGTWWKDIWLFVFVGVDLLCFAILKFAQPLL